MTDSPATLDIAGTVSLVTGTDKGIGSEVARLLGARGTTVLAAARDPESAPAALQRPGRASIGAMAQGFHGWSEAALDFYRGLEADNSKAWWTAHKSTYETEVRPPFEALSDLVAAEFGPLTVTRPYRDIRFSKDKTLYKTRGYAVGEGEGGERYYVEISAAGLVVGCGYWMMAGDQLDRYRAAVDDDDTGEALAAAVAEVRAARLDIGGDALKTAPRGYPRDHPRVELLRHKGLAGIRRFDPAAWLHTRAAARRITDSWRAAAPIIAWLAAHVGPSTEVPPEAGRYG